ncbi:hypothetical protein AMS68_002734 [Peltaster fructicola]|uniref:Uncharacterized protein n=1 Tax=Peltaster fructicola TaxID=286661 RepID=A0A6H0XR34_9PEZI|nr:hypothetical protein AMS68_002734 [Peltaster fructicola]
MASTTQEAKQPANKPLPTANTRLNRLPAPTLFVGPPSRNASQLSLSRQAAESGVKPTREPLQRQKSAFGRNDTDSALKPPKDIPTLQLRRPSDKSIETKWREMQNTLNEVEFTAQSPMHVFGEKHAAALDELRRAQIELARAWGRGNDEQAAAPEVKDDIEKSESVLDPKVTRKRADTEASASTQLSGESEASDVTVRSVRSHLEEDTAEDVRLANERRAANEAYFKRSIRASRKSLQSSKLLQKQCVALKESRSRFGMEQVPRLTMTLDKALLCKVEMHIQTTSWLQEC